MPFSYIIFSFKRFQKSCFYKNSSVQKFINREFFAAYIFLNVQAR